jgi:hypothetical protein
MIRLFNALCKVNIPNSYDDIQRFQHTTSEYSHYEEQCPKCGAVGKMTSHGDYSRWLVHINQGKIAENLLNPKRFKCSSCNSTHALLPDVIVPNSPYSLLFMLNVLSAYIQRDSTVVDLCVNYRIAVSTLYRWKKRLLTQKALFLGYLFTKDISLLSFINDLIHVCTHLSIRLSRFYRTHGFSFMENKGTPTQSTPP